MHWDDNAWPEHIGHLKRLQVVYRIYAADWNEENVDIADHTKAFFVGQVAYISGMKYAHIIHLNDIHHIGPPLAALRVVMPCRHALYQRILNEMFPWTADYHWIFHGGRHVVMVIVIVAAGDGVACIGPSA